MRKGIIEVYLNIPVILNGEVLTSDKKDWERLSGLGLGQLRSLKQLSSSGGLHRYGKKGKYGAIEIHTH